MPINDQPFTVQLLALEYASSLVFDTYCKSQLRLWLQKEISTTQFVQHEKTIYKDMFDFSDPFEVADELNRIAEQFVKFAKEYAYEHFLKGSALISEIMVSP